MRFVKDLRKYWDYTKQSAKAELKSEVANSYLNWLWWILDPMLYMMVYTFIAQIVFNSKEQFFPIFVFIGMLMWRFFNQVVQGSVKIVKNNGAIVGKVYLPKFILVVQKMLVSGFKLAISFSLVIILMIIYRVPVTYRVVYLLPVLVVLMVVTFGIGNLLLHFGVFVEDLSNVMVVVLRLTFYMSGIFYNILVRVPAPYNKVMLVGNPMAFLINSGRRCMLYGQTPDLRLLLMWFGIGMVLSCVSVKIIYKYENSYVKVI